MLKAIMIKSALIVLICSVSLAVYARAEEPIQVNVLPGELVPALESLSKQVAVELVYQPEQLKEFKTKGVSGVYTAEAAVRILLKGTPLELQTDPSGAMVIAPAGKEKNGKTSSDVQTSNGASTPAQEVKKNSSSDFRLAQENQGAPSSSFPVSNAPQNSGSTSSAGQLTEVVVTAQKRTENVQDVPASLTVLSAANLQTQGVVSFSDYMTLVPSLSQFSGGADGHGATILRGLNTGYYQFSNTTGYYIDDVPFSATSALSYGAFLTMDPDLTDIDNLEILNGPQATLYGASTLGGLIKVVTKQADLNSDSGEVRLDGSTIDGGGSGYGLVGIANLVLIPGELALRLSGFDRDTPGYMTNVKLGTEDRDASRKKGGRAVLRWVPTDDLEIKVSAFVQSLTVDGWNYEDINLQTLSPLTGPYTYSDHFDPYFHTTYGVYNTTVNYKVGSIGTLTSSTSYGTYRDHEIQDYTLQYGSYFNGFAPTPVPANTATIAVFGPVLNKFTEELRFTSQRLGGFEWIAGLFYTKEQVNFPDSNFNVIPPSQQPLPGPDGNIITLDAPATYKEEAAFADLTYYFTDTIDLTLGGRYSHNQQEAAFCQTGFASIPGCVDNSSSDSDFTYLTALSWHPTPDINTYARVATSYRPGGPQQEPLPGFPKTFKPDSLTNYEVGLKGDWLDRRLRTNLAIYDMRWYDVQLTSNLGGYSVITNAGKATVKGVELETQVVPVERFTLGVNVAYTDAKLDSVSAAVTQYTGAVAGDSLPSTPSWSASATADYVQPLNGTFTSNYGLTYRYQGSKWSDYPGDPLNTGVVIPHYDTVDIRTGLDWSRYKLQFRVANIFNSHGIQTVVDERIDGNPPAWAAIIRPRMFTLSLAVTF